MEAASRRCCISVIILLQLVSVIVLFWYILLETRIGTVLTQNVFVVQILSRMCQLARFILSKCFLRKKKVVWFSRWSSGWFSSPSCVFCFKYEHASTHKCFPGQRNSGQSFCYSSLSFGFPWTGNCCEWHWRKFWKCEKLGFGCYAPQSITIKPWHFVLKCMFWYTPEFNSAIHWNCVYTAFLSHL